MSSSPYCASLIAYRYYSAFIATRICSMTRGHPRTQCDGANYYPTTRSSSRTISPPSPARPRRADAGGAVRLRPRPDLAVAAPSRPGGARLDVLWASTRRGPVAGRDRHVGNQPRPASSPRLPSQAHPVIAMAGLASSPSTRCRHNTTIAMTIPLGLFMGFDLRLAGRAASSGDGDRRSSACSPRSPAAHAQPLGRLVSPVPPVADDRHRPRRLRLRGIGPAGLAAVARRAAT